MSISFTGNTRPAPNVQVGITADGELKIDGGSVLLCSTVLAGESSGVTGAIGITGAGSRLETQGTDNNVIIGGDRGTASLTMSNGARLLTSKLVIANAGEATVDILSGAQISIDGAGGTQPILYVANNEYGTANTLRASANLKYLWSRFPHQPDRRRSRC
jgi:T5SS/PEP-CTERM-associated repeat protein